MMSVADQTPPGNVPQKRGWPPWAVWLAACGAIAVITGVAIALLAFYVFNSLIDTGDIDEIPAATVKTGQLLAWRELGNWPLDGEDSFLDTLGANPQAVDLTGDGREEVFVIIEKGLGLTQRLVVGLDGTIYLDPIPDNRVVNAVPASFDYDGDGTAELAASEGSDQTGIYSKSGELIATLDGYSLSHYGWPLADIDGDGHSELLLAEQLPAGKLIAYGKECEQVWTVDPVGDAWYSISAADVDGDGLDEVVTLDGLQNIVALGYMQDPATLPQIGQYCGLVVCMDVNGDGFAELIEPASGYKDLANGRVVKFIWPQLNLLNAGYHSDQECQVAVCDLTGDGRREVIISGNPYDLMNPIKRTAIYAFNQQGDLVYQEEFGEKLRGITTVMDGNTAHVAVQTITRLLVYP